MTNRCFLRCPVWEQSTHHFPNHKKHHDRFKAWVEAIDRKLETDEDYEYFRTKRLCHIHFIPIYCYNNKRLSPLAIPTLYLTKKSRDDYWSKDLELRKSMLLQSKLPQDDISIDEIPKDEISKNEMSIDEISKDEMSKDEMSKDEMSKDEMAKDEMAKDEMAKDEISKDEILKDEISKDEISMDEISNVEISNVEISKGKILKYKISKNGIPKVEITYDDIPMDETAPNNEKAIVAITEGNLPSNNAQSQLRSDKEESLVNLLIADILNGQNENYAVDVPKPPLIDLSPSSPVEVNLPNTVTEIIIEYVPATEVSVQKSLMAHTPTDIMTCEVIEELPAPPVFSHEIIVDSTLLETCGVEEIKTNFDSTQDCVKPPKKKRKSKYGEISWESSVRIPMEHNYTKASIVAPTSHISSNGVHPKKIIMTLKNEVQELRKQLKFYKQRCKELLKANQQTVSKKNRSKKITTISQKGQASRKKVYKNIITYLKLKNVGCSITLP